MVRQCLGGSGRSCSASNTDSSFRLTPAGRRSGWGKPPSRATVFGRGTANDGDGSTETDDLGCPIRGGLGGGDRPRTLLDPVEARYNRCESKCENLPAVEQPRPSYSSQLPPPATSRRVAGTLLGVLAGMVLVSAVAPIEWVGERPLHDAARWGSASLVRVLVGVYDPDTETRSGSTALHLAARGGHADVARVLVAAGADLDVRDERGRPPLYLAAQKGHADVASVLIQAGAAVDARGTRGLTPLYLAALFGHADVARVLVEAGADVDAQTEYGSTALSVAQRRNYKEVNKLLAEAGARK